MLNNSLWQKNERQNHLSTRALYVAQVYPWIKFSFLLFQNHYHTCTCTQKQKKIKFKARIKLNHNI